MDNTPKERITEENKQLFWNTGRILIEGLVILTLYFELSCNCFDNCILKSAYEHQFWMIYKAETDGSLFMGAMIYIVFISKILL